MNRKIKQPVFTALTIMLFCALANRSDAQAIQPVIPPFGHSLVSQKEGLDHTSYIFTCPDIPDATVTATCILQQLDRKLLGRFPLRRKTYKTGQDTLGLRFSVGCLSNDIITANVRIEVYVRYDDKTKKDGQYLLPLESAKPGK